MTSPRVWDEAAAQPPAVHPRVRALRLAAVLTVAAFFILVVPALGGAGIVELHNVNRLGRFMCFAVAAIGIDLIWGCTGVLSLCQAVFFCMGGYAMAMFLSLPQGGGDVRADYNNIPQFFFFNNVDKLPGFWKPFESMPVAIAIALLLPAVSSAMFGFFIFRSRVRGVYFSIITQAVAWGAYLLLSRNEMLLGGTNGLTNFYKPLNQAKVWVIGLYLASVAAVIAAFLICRAVMRSRAGRVLLAVRDNESRLLFAGYRPERYKVFAFCVGAVLAAVGGMLYAPQNAIITPNIMRVSDSIWMVVWVALGGRGKLWGAILGTLLVRYTESILTTALPDHWLYIQGAMFIAVVLLFPEGFVGQWQRIEEQVEAGQSAVKIALGAAPTLAVLVVVLADGLSLVPAALGTVVAGLALKYWLLLAVVALSAAAHYVPAWLQRGAPAEPALPTAAAGRAQH